MPEPVAAVTEPPAHQLAPAERKLLALIAAAPEGRLGAGAIAAHNLTEEAWSLTRRGLLNITKFDLGLGVLGFKLRPCAALVAAGRLDFVRRDDTLWRPVVDGAVIEEICRCHQREVCETLDRYLRGWARTELAALDQALGGRP